MTDKIIYVSDLLYVLIYIWTSAILSRNRDKETLLLIGKSEKTN